MQLARGAGPARPVALAALALLALACADNPLSGFFLTQAEPLVATVRATTLFTGPYPDLVVTVSQDTVYASWWIATGSPCYTFSASGEASSDTLIATLVAARVPVGCTAVVPGFAYTLTVGAVPAGLYTLRLMHQFRGGPDSSGTAAILPLAGP